MHPKDHTSVLSSISAWGGHSHNSGARKCAEQCSEAHSYIRSIASKNKKSSTHHIYRKNHKITDISYQMIFHTCWQTREMWTKVDLSISYTRLPYHRHWLNKLLIWIILTISVIIYKCKGTCSCKASACDLIALLAGRALSKSIKIARWGCSFLWVMRTLSGLTPLWAYGGSKLCICFSPAHSCRQHKSHN